MTALIKTQALEADNDNSSDDVSASDNSTDSDSDDGFSEEEEIEKKEKRTPKNTKFTQKIKPPTLEEINELKETRNLFHSNLFRLQVKEMLTELQIADKLTKYLNSWMDDFKAFLSNIKSQEECENSMQWLEQCPLKFPLALSHLQLESTQQKKQLKFQFIKPKLEPFYIGAASTGTLMGSMLVADVCVQMPAEYMQKDNYLNMAYDKKRALYITYLGAKMLRSKKHFSGLTEEHLRFSFYANNPLKPVLEVTPPVESAGKNISDKLCIRIFVSAERNTFKLSRFVPWNNNIRASAFYNNNDDKNDIPLATPTYNSNVLFDLTMASNQDAVENIIGKHKNLQDGLMLLKVWLKQRELNIGYSGFGAHLFAMFIVHLYKQRKLQPNMSSYQVARTVWNHLGNSAWDEDGKGISLCDNHVESQPTLEQFHAYYDVVFVDVTGYYNICAQLSPQLYKWIRQECKWAVDMLNDTKINSFQSLFMIKKPLHMQFEHLLKINKVETIEQLQELHIQPADRYDTLGHAYPQLLKRITTLLCKGLGKRIQYILPIQQSIPSWAANTKPPMCGNCLNIGLILNSEHACEVINKGPESIAEDAADFRSFWGEKAQLRRFQDGTITESVVWGTVADPLMEKRLIVRSIVLYLLQHHLQLNANDVEYVAGELDVVCRLTTAYKTEQIREHYKDILPNSDSEFLALRVIRCFDDLARKLRDLKDLPLDIVSITGISPVFRYCEMEPVLPEARFIGNKLFARHVHRAVIQLSASGKWPSQLDALRALKVAFYFQIATLLQEKYHLRSQVTHDGILVLKQGYCFGIELAHPKEVALLRREAPSTDTDAKKSIIKYVDCDESIALERRHYVLPRINGTLHALYQEQPSFGPTVAIAKRWLSSHLIDHGLWPDECTELLIASQFLKQYTQQPTCSPQTGFMRFLHLLANTDWQTEMCFINFQNSMDENELTELECKFNTQRNAFPPLCIATAYDHKNFGNVWTNMQTPNTLVLGRVIILARETLDILQPIFTSERPQSYKATRIFQASSAGYDLVIQLKPDMIPNTLALELGSPFVARTKPNWRLPIADSMLLHTCVQHLREAYSDYAAFFYNPHGGKEIAVLWKPDIENEKDFKVTEVNGYTLSSNGKRLQCRKSTFIEDFKFILKDMYLCIDTPDAVLRLSQSSLTTTNTSESITTNTKKRYFNMKTKTTDLPTKKAKIQPIKNSKTTKKDVKLKTKKLQLDQHISITKRKTH